MFRMFMNKTQKPVNDKVQEIIANTIVSKSVQLQERWAAIMHQLTDKLSKRTKKCGIILFFLVAAGFSFYTLIDSFSATRKKSFQIFKIEIPKNILQDGEETKAFTIIPEKEFRKIHQFRMYMDSLAQSNAGKKIADSILLARKDLMDSIIQIENIYHLQQSPKK